MFFLKGGIIILNFTISPFIYKKNILLIYFNTTQDQDINIKGLEEHFIMHLL